MLAIFVTVCGVLHVRPNGAKFEPLVLVESLTSKRYQNDPESLKVASNDSGRTMHVCRFFVHLLCVLRLAYTSS